jgi:hypothetical protein
LLSLSPFPLFLIDYDHLARIDSICNNVFDFNVLMLTSIVFHLGYCYHKLLNTKYWILYINKIMHEEI